MNLLRLRKNKPRLPREGDCYRLKMLPGGTLYTVSNGRLWRVSDRGDFTPSTFDTSHLSEFFELVGSV